MISPVLKMIIMITELGGWRRWPRIAAILSARTNSCIQTTANDLCEWSCVNKWIWIQINVLRWRSFFAQNQPDPHTQVYPHIKFRTNSAISYFIRLLNENPCNGCLILFNVYSTIILQQHYNKCKSECLIPKQNKIDVYTLCAFCILLDRWMKLHV